MDEAARARLQIRAVMVVFRAEMAHPRTDVADESRQRFKAQLRRRSLELLDNARAKLDGQAPWHPEVLAELLTARAEVVGED